MDDKAIFVPFRDRGREGTFGHAAKEWTVKLIGGIKRSAAASAKKPLNRDSHFIFSKIII